MAQACNSSTWETEAGGLWVLDSGDPISRKQRGNLKKQRPSREEKLRSLNILKRENRTLFFFKGKKKKGNLDTKKHNSRNKITEVLESK